jgi:hypothetical protein
MRIPYMVAGILVATVLTRSVCGQGTVDGGWRVTATAEGAVGPTVGAEVTPAAALDPVAPKSAAPAASPAAPATIESRRTLTRVSSGSGTLPNDQGQLWREYDISPYTLRVTSTSRPEQAIVDWILRETGYEAWHTEPLAILSATPRKLLVYHTPEMQATVADIVDRFVSSEAETHAFSLHVITLDNPNWRARAQGLLQPVQVQTPGVQAWLVEREAATVLLAELRRRTDFREHSSPQLAVNNGQSTVVSATRAKGYVRNVIPRPEVWPGFEPEVAQIDEGYALEFSPLLSVDGRMIDATIKCNVDQVEKLVPVVLDVPSPVAPRQRTKIEVPQLTSFRFHERFRWPVDKVLLVSMGVVPLPAPADGRSVIPGIALPLPSGPARADLLVFVESKGVSGQAARVTQAATPASSTYRGNR